MIKSNKIYVAGHTGLVGRSLINNLTTNGYTNIVTINHGDLDLTDKNKVDNFFKIEQPEFVFLAAAKVGGIYANNTFPAEFIYNNLAIQSNIIDACYRFKTNKLLFLGSCCIYPKYANVPVKEEYLLTGELEPTNECYAIAKIAGIKMCQAYNKQYGCNFISVMPCNLYGKYDNFHPTNSHVIPGLINKFTTAIKNKSNVTCWGTGESRREFMYVDDMTDACIFLMNNYTNDKIINIGCNIDYTIKELVELISELTGFNGKIVWDTTKPNGTPKRILDSSKIFNMGWKPNITLRNGLIETINWYNSNTSKHI